MIELPHGLTLNDLTNCAERELVLRRRVYPSWINRQKLTAKKADHELHCMEAIVELLKLLELREFEKKEGIK